MVSAGRVLLMPKGEYNAVTAYTMLDLVSYNGSSYIAKKSTTGNLPTNTEYWQLSAYGGSAANLAGNFATLETTDYASQEYAIDDFLVTKNSVFCKVIAAIDIGDELVLDTNIEATDVGELVQAIIDYVAGLDAKDVKLQGMTAISAQTDLDDMTTPGNFYKSSTSFYVTNAPEDISEELTAVFRLTVENGSDTTDKYIQTLRTNDGKTYTRGYDGSDWSDWIEVASVAAVEVVAGDVSDLDSAKQPKTLATPITVDGVQQTTNEDALGAINTYAASIDADLANEVSARAQLGVHNLMPNIAKRNTYSSSGTVTVNADKSITINGTFDATATPNIDYATDATDAVWDLSDIVGVPLVASILDAAVEGITLRVGYYDGTGSRVGLETVSTKADVTFPSGAVKGATYLRIAAGAYSNVTVKPMIKLATDAYDGYEPYAPTNQQLSGVIPTMTQNGAHNLLPYPYLTTTKTERGITYTDNGDGTITISGSNTSGSSAYFNFGCIDYGETNFYATNKTNGLYKLSNGDNPWPSGVDFTYNATSKLSYLGVPSGTSITSPITLYPTITKAEDPSNAWTPYAKTNRALTRDISQDITVSSSITTIKAVISDICSQLNSIIANTGQTVCGQVLASGAGSRYGFIATRNTSTVFKLLLYSENYIYTAIYNNGTVTAYSYSGTALT